jgi:hypothetical protein
LRRRHLRRRHLIVKKAWALVVGAVRLFPEKAWALVVGAMHWVRCSPVILYAGQLV